MGDVFKERILKVRGERSQREFAEFLGVSLSQYKRYEKNEGAHFATHIVSKRLEEREVCTCSWLNGHCMYAERIDELAQKNPKIMENIVGWDADAIAKIRRGIVLSPSFFTRIAGYFGVSVSYLFGETDDPTPAKLLSRQASDFRAMRSGIEAIAKCVPTGMQQLVKECENEKAK